ncbi:MAG: hypothetical protein NT146_14165 [Mycobacterium sp.]|nr:hypothetical protein [Mycobacterium sp.]
MSNPKTKKRNQRILMAIIGTIAAAAAIVPMGLGLLQAREVGQQPDLPTAPTTTAPPLTIKGLPVRPVVSAFVTTPAQCPAPPPPPPDQPTRICDINRTAVYELGPEGLSLDLTNVDSFLNPLTGVQLVQMTMTPESSRSFAEFTAARVGQQVAFVRGTTVVWGPKIGGPIDGQVLQLSGELTAEQAKEIAGMLGEKR